MIHRLLFEGKININRRAYFWNLVSSTTFSMQSALFLWIVTKGAGAAEAGTFVILYTVAQTLYSVGHYNIRDFQVSDIREEYSFSNYYTARWITSGMMVLIALVYSMIKGLSANRIAVLLCLVGYRLTECFEDVYHGHVQRKGRFDVAAMCASIRAILASLAFCAAFLLTRNQLSSSLLMFIVSLLSFLLLIRMIKTEIGGMQVSFAFGGVFKLLKDCFPVFIGAFLYVYLINAPKYAIDEALPQEMQTIYNILYMPAFVINTFSMFVYKPQMLHMSELWNSRDLSGFRRQMLLQVAIVVIFTVFVAAGGWLIGLWLLEKIYGIALMQYRSLFALLLCFGGIMAAAYYFNSLITVMRKQQFILIGYISTLVISLLFTGRLVSRFQIQGACYAYGLIAVFLMLFYLLVIVVTMTRARGRSRAKD